MPTPPDPEEPRSGPVLEPVRVLRLRRFDALAELMREVRPEPEAYDCFAPDAGPAEAPRAAEDETQELPRLAASGRPAPGVPGPGRGLRRAAVAVAVCAAALVGFGGALLLPARQEADAAARPSRPTTSAPPATAPAAPATTGPSTDPSTDPDGAGTLRQGDAGPEVADLQQRLLRVPDVYRGGSTDGTYDAVLTAAVARFQLWYGISGDETGVYGDDTRRALESRTSPADGG